MRCDPFFVKIKDGLSQSLNPKLFEQCAADLLRENHPSLVPVLGGNDSGFDGAIADNEGEPFPLIVTTSKDGIGNLTRNLGRYQQQVGIRKKAVFATSQELTPRKRKNISERANELGFVLVQVYDQEAIANLLYHSPRWCKELLGLSGRPSALSHIPKNLRHFMQNQRLIGRDKELEWLLNTDGDSVIVGQPGSGKTCILYQLANQDRGLFIVSRDQTAVANSILELQPPTIFVDDAGNELDLIRYLMHFRQSTGTRFQIITACWPSDKDPVIQQLDIGEAQSLDLHPLIRNQIVDIIKEVGLDGPDDFVRYIVDQAIGLPGLATTLARLYLQGEPEAIVRGHVLKRDLLRSVKPELKEDVESVLAGFSAGGEAGIKMSTVMETLGIPLIKIRKIIARLATGGVIVDKPCMYLNHLSSEEQTIAVQPATLRYALVHDLFFSGPAPLPREILNKLIDQPRSISDVAETIMGASVYHDNVPETLLQELVERAGDAITFERYASIGHRQTLWLLERHPEILLTIGDCALNSAPEEVIPLLLKNVPTAPQLLYQKDSDPLHLIKKWTLSGIPGTEEALYRRRIVLEASIRLLNHGGDVDTAVSASCIAVSPLYETNTTDPGAGNTFIATHGLLTPHEITQLKSLWDSFLDAIADRNDFNWNPIFVALNSWAHPNSLLQSLRKSKGNKNPQELSFETQRAFTEIAIMVVERLARMAVNKPAVVQRLKPYIKVTGASVSPAVY